MNEGPSLRAAAKRTGISLPTAFAWRHKFLDNSRKYNTNTTLHSYKTTAVLKLPYSNKGSRRKTESSSKTPSQTFIQMDRTGKFTLTEIPSKHRKLFVSQIIENIQLNRNENLKQKILSWLEKFKGIATKYLENYWAWFVTEAEVEERKNQMQYFVIHCLA